MSPGAEQNAFRMSSLAPLVGPLTTCGRKGDAHALSLYYIASWCADHGFHGSTGWGCLYPGAEQNAFRMSRLAPLVSPGKTWEGFLGGMVFQLLLIASLAVYLPAEISFIKLSLLVFPVALYSVVGDLFESMVKRNSGVKDSGALLPGHGGVLDRIDGIMAALPLYALVLGVYSS